MNVKEFHPDEDERIERVINEVAGTLGNKGVGLLLLEGDPERGVEPLPEGEPRNALREAQENTGAFTEAMLQNIIRDAKAVHDLETFILSGIREKITRATEQGHNRVSLIEREMDRLPRWLAEDLLYQEIDRAEGRMFDQPDDYVDLIHLRQIEADWFGGGQNRQERKQLWDEVLKFSRYRVEVVWNGGAKFIRRLWSQRSTTAHNDVLRRARHEHGEDIDVDEVNTKVEELFMPETDPLEDIEEFVYRW